jgi:threonine aldolase
MNTYNDLRSDTVTKPSKEMLEAMVSAEVGDDVYGEDPTVNKLQILVAEMLGKEDALFVTSGTLGNQLCLKTHTEPGDEVIVESLAHIFRYETAGPSFISQIQIFPVPGVFGMMKLQDIVESIRPDVYYYPKTKLICLENTHNNAGGTIIDNNYIKDVSVIANTYGLKMHLDGARLWNASIESGIPLKECAQYFDSINVCLSKGLGAPVGSVIAGPKTFITKARKYRKILGGGMRQAGVLAAAGIYAIQNNLQKLHDDHRRAKYLGECISKYSKIDIDLNSIQTNMVSFGFQDPKVDLDEIINIFKENGVIIGKGARGKLRLVTHLDISDPQIEKTADIINKIFKKYN